MTPFQRQEASLTYVYEYDELQDDCGAFALASTVPHRTHLYIRPFTLQDTSDDVTLVTQLSVDRIGIFEKVLSSWSGPVSAAIYVTDPEFAQLREYLDQSAITSRRTNVAIHAVFKQGTFYPINYLRNVALNASKTAYVYLADVDFLPSKTLYDTLRRSVRERDMSHRALVVPAFELRVGESLDFPETKAELISLWDDSKIRMFRGDIWPRGHSPTDYERWKIANVSYTVSWMVDYEPYIVLSRKETPQYDERFVGFGWNKVTHIMTLHATGWTFEVLADAFTVHHPHAASFEITKYRNSALYRKCMRTLRGKFVRDLHVNRGTRT